MYFKQFLHDDLGCSSYFIASRQAREAAAGRSDDLALLVLCGREPEPEG